MASSLGVTEISDLNLATDFRAEAKLQLLGTDVGKFNTSVFL